MRVTGTTETEHIQHYRADCPFCGYGNEVTCTPDETDFTDTCEHIVEDECDFPTFVFQNDDEEEYDDDSDGAFVTFTVETNINGVPVNQELDRFGNPYRM